MIPAVLLSSQALAIKPVPSAAEICLDAMAKFETDQTPSQNLQLAAAEFLFLNGSSLQDSAYRGAAQYLQNLVQGQTEPDDHYSDLNRDILQKSTVLSRYEQERLLRKIDREMGLKLSTPETTTELVPHHSLAGRVRHLFVEDPPLEFQDVQTFSANLRAFEPERRLHELQKTLEHVRVLSLFEAQKILAVLDDDQVGGAWATMRPKTLDDRSLSTPERSLAGLAGLTVGAGRRVLKDFPLTVSAENLKNWVSLRQIPLLEVIQRYLSEGITFDLGADFEFLNRLVMSTPVDQVDRQQILLKLYLKLDVDRAVWIFDEYADKILKHKDKAKILESWIAGFKKELHDSGFYQRIAEDPVPERELRLFLKKLNALEDPVVRSTQLFDYMSQATSLTDSQFTEIYEAIPKNLDLGLNENGWENLIGIMRSRRIDWVIYEGFAPYEVLIAWEALRKINHVKNPKQFTQTFNALTAHVKAVVEDKPFAVDVIRLFTSEFSAIMDPLMARHY